MKMPNPKPAKKRSLGPWEKVAAIGLYQRGQSLRRVAQELDSAGLRVGKSTLNRLMDRHGLTRPEPAELYARMAVHRE